MAEIHAPNSMYTGVSASVEFKDGVGSTDVPHLISWFKENGYKVIEDAVVEQEPEKKQEKKQPKKKEG